MVTAMDQAIGDLVTHLKNNGLYDNTLIVFTTDVIKTFNTSALRDN